MSEDDEIPSKVVSWFGGLLSTRVPLGFQYRATTPVVLLPQQSSIEEDPTTIDEEQLISEQLNDRPVNKSLSEVSRQNQQDVLKSTDRKLILNSESDVLNAHQKLSDHHLSESHLSESEHHHEPRGLSLDSSLRRDHFPLTQTLQMPHSQSLVSNFLRDRKSVVQFADQTPAPTDRPLFDSNLDLQHSQLEPLSQQSVAESQPHFDSIDYQRLQHNQRNLEAYILHLQATLTSEQAKAHAERLNQTTAPQIIISNTTEVIASSRNQSTIETSETGPLLEWWIRFLSSRFSQCFILGGALFAIHLLRQRLHHSWRIQNLQVRSDVSLLLRFSRMINTSIGAVVGMATAANQDNNVAAPTRPILRSMMGLLYPTGFIF